MAYCYIDNPRLRNIPGNLGLRVGRALDPCCIAWRFTGKKKDVTAILGELNVAGMRCCYVALAVRRHPGTFSMLAH
jgi:hypothetical protein